MNPGISLTDIHIRTVLQPGDLGFVIYMHGSLYKEEYNYGIEFETYVAAGLVEFYQNYDPQKDRVWIAEYNGSIIGFVLLMHRGAFSAQLRYFIILPAFRGLGLGKKLMQHCMEHLRETGFQNCYLWTTNEQETAAALYTRVGFKFREEKLSEAFGKSLYEQKYEIDLREE